MFKKKNQPSGSYAKQTVTKQRRIIGILSVSIIVVLIILGLGWNQGWFAPIEVPTTPVVGTTSSFTLIDYRTGEDVSAWVEVSVWTPDEDDLPFDDNDAQTLANFDEEVSSQDADDVAIDLRDHSVAWLEIDPDFESDFGGYDGAFNALATRDFRKIVGGGNYDYYVYVYHAPSNVSVSMLNRGEMDAVDGEADNLGNLGAGYPYNNTWIGGGSIAEPGTSGTYQVILEAPMHSTDGYHAGDTGGDAWEIDADELADIVADAAVHTWDFDDELEWLQDQSNFRTIAPYYDLTDDANDAYYETIEKFTNCFTVRITANTSISLTDTATTQINCSIIARDNIDVPAEVIIHGAFIDIVFYEPITLYNQMYNFDVRLAFGTNIQVDSVTTNRILTPSDRNNLGAVTLLNTMFLQD